MASMVQPNFKTALLFQLCAATMIAFLIFSPARATDDGTPIVIGYTSVQPPYVIDEGGRGLTFELTYALDQTTPNQRFIVKRFYPARIGHAIDEKKFDVIAFNNLLWGWKKSGATQSSTLIHDRDIFFSGVAPVDKSLANKVAATRGFTYAFADYSLEKLTKLPNVLLVDDEVDTIPLVRRGRVGKGIASEALLRWHMHANSGGQARLKLLDEVDHEYDRAFIVLPHSRLSLAQLNHTLQRLKDAGDLRRIFADYGLPEPSLAPPRKPE